MRRFELGQRLTILVVEKDFLAGLARGQSLGGQTIGVRYTTALTPPDAERALPPMRWPVMLEGRLSSAYADEKSRRSRATLIPSSSASSDASGSGTGSGS